MPIDDRHARNLREQVEARHGPIHEQDVPTTTQGVADLARRDPDRFNALLEAGRLSLAPTTNTED